MWHIYGKIKWWWSQNVVRPKLINCPQWNQSDDVLVHWCRVSELIRKRSRDSFFPLQWGYLVDIQNDVKSCAWCLFIASYQETHQLCLLIYVCVVALCVHSVFLSLLCHLCWSFDSISSSQDRRTSNKQWCSRTQHQPGFAASTAALIKISTITPGRTLSFMSP